jgi:hypothetical protein
MREIERANHAMAKAKSWHYHQVRRPLGPADTYDGEVLCPSFEHAVATGTAFDGTPGRWEHILYNGKQYSVAADGRWQRVGGEAYILDCERGALAGDENSFHLSVILEDSTVRRGEMKEVEGEPCRVFDVVVPIPDGREEKERHFAICINEEDHLVRETRGTPYRFRGEGYKTYTKWNSLSEPPLPADFPKD